MAADESALPEPRSEVAAAHSADLTDCPATVCPADPVTAFHRLAPGMGRQLHPIPESVQLDASLYYPHILQPTHGHGGH